MFCHDLALSPVGTKARTIIPEKADIADVEYCRATGRATGRATEKLQLLWLKNK